MSFFGVVASSDWMCCLTYGCRYRSSRTHLSRLRLPRLVTHRCIGMNHFPFERRGKGIIVFTAIRKMYFQVADVSKRGLNECYTGDCVYYATCEATYMLPLCYIGNGIH